MEPRRTYVVSLYGAEGSVVVEAVQRDERARIDGLDDLPERIRRWEEPEQPAAAPLVDTRPDQAAGTR